MSRLGPGLTLNQWLQHATQTLAASSPSARRDAEIILRHVCTLTPTELITRADQILPAPAQIKLEDFLERRRTGEPVAYLVEKREFWSLDLCVSAATLIPRPETELLVEQALARIPAGSPWTIVDLGTGSGAVALAVASERPTCQVVATDLSESALAVARLNAQRLGLPQVIFLQGSWFAPLNAEPVELILSNPPYVREHDPHLKQGDVRFEPALALRAGTDGLAALRVIISEARTHLKTGGSLLVEHGYDQAAAVTDLFHSHGYQAITCYRDLAGQARVSAGQQP